jgi:hypothetical protein
MQKRFCQIQLAFRRALQTFLDNWVSASEIFLQRKGFQELPAGGEPPTPLLSHSCVHGGSSGSCGQLMPQSEEATGMVGPQLQHGVRPQRAYSH